MEKKKKHSNKTSKKDPKSVAVRYERHSALPTEELSDSSKLGRPREWTEHLIEQKRNALEKWLSNPKNYFLISFMTENDLHHEHITRFCKYSEAFRATHARAQLIQEQRIVEAALTRKFDGNFAKFVLQNKAGWKERSEVSGDQSNPLALILDKISNKPQDPLEIDYDE